MADKNTFQPNFHVNGPSDFKEALEKLDKNISSITKQISYLDVYNIVDAVTNRDTFEAQVTNLVPNTSLVINTEPFYVNDELYNTGDLILKLVDERVIHVKAQSGGLYFPSQIEKNGNNYNLTYTYSPTRPLIENSTSKVGDKEPIPNPSEQITFTGLAPGNQNDNYIYGIWEKYGNIEEKTQHIFNRTQQDNVNVQPLIKFYLVKEGSILDEIVLEYLLEEIIDNTDSTNNKKWRITIKTDLDSVIDKLWIKVK